MSPRFSCACLAATLAFCAAARAADGDLDATFGSAGKVHLGPNTGFSGPVANDVAVQPDGKIVVVGYETNATDGLESWRIARLNANGTVDTSFASDGMLDWVGNTAAPTYPKGMEIDGFTAAALTEADRRCAEPELRREGPAFLWKNSRLYRLLSVTAPEGQERPELDLKVRSPDDLARLEPVLAHFAGRGDFTLADVLGFLEGAAP